MIVTIVGDVGAGKSYTAVKYAVEHHAKGYYIYANFNMIGLKRFKKVSLSDILDNPLDHEHPESAIFWTKYFKHPSIFIIDEAVGWLDSRASMSKNNRCVTRFVSQIRKIFGANEDGWLIIVSQLSRMLDVRTRLLTHYWIIMEKIRKDPPLFLLKRTRNGRLIESKTYEFDPVIGNSYDSHEIVL